MADSFDAESIQTLIKAVKEISSEIAVLLVANVKQVTSMPEDYEGHSIITEYFSEDELEEITQAFRVNNIYTDISFSEIDFIKKVINHEFDKVDRQYKIVYTTAQSGTGPGRKSLVPSLCSLFHLPLIGSNAYVRNLCRHKYHYNSILTHNGLPAVPSWLYDAPHGWLLNRMPPTGLKLIIKPIYESASIGIDNNSIISMASSSITYIKELSKKFNQPVIAQEFISGYEIEVPIINYLTPVALGIVGIAVNGNKRLDNDILTYENVYNDNYSFFDFKEFPETLIKKIKADAEQSANLLGIEGLGRIDFRLTETGKYYITDVSTNPHIVSHSSYGHIFKNLNLSYDTLPLFMLAVATKKFGWI
jgi:D-alanine-D-alanine ligase